jgi:serine-type D-Ala-D-Ala carboxypeptidase (penicillin-binding protein 5/6)
MKIKRARYTYGHDRQARKPRRRLLFAGLFSVILLLFCGYGVASFVKYTSMPSAETVPLQMTLAEDVQFAWPAVGQAAVASVEDGLLARSSDNEQLRPIASIAKVITALAIMEKQPFELGQEGQTYTITREDIANMSAYIAEDGSVLPLLIGTELTQFQAMQRMLIASDNNMADILVGRTFGSKEAYVSYANDMLKRMGLSQTMVADASGFSPDTASTPSELVTIGISALKNPVIAEIVAQPQAQIPDVGIITNTNQLLGDDGVIGIKTGTTDEAGHCLLFAARYVAEDGEKVTIVGVIMGDTNAASLFSDSRILLASAKQGFGLVESQPIKITSPHDAIKNGVGMVHQHEVLCYCSPLQTSCSTFQSLIQEPPSCSYEPTSLKQTPGLCPGV